MPISVKKSDSKSTVICCGFKEFVMLFSIVSINNCDAAKFSEMHLDKYMNIIKVIKCGYIRFHVTNIN